MTPRDALVEAMATSISDCLADEAQWNDAVASALDAAARDHLEALLNLCGDVRTATIYSDGSTHAPGFRSDEIGTEAFVVVPPMSEEATDADPAESNGATT